MAMLMQRFGGQTYALMRIVSGFLFLWHGTSKLLEFPKPSGAPEWVVYGAGPIELIGGTLIMIGLCTRWAAFIASGMAATAYFIVHAKQGFYPIMNGGEQVALYCFVFLYISTHGAGIWSVDGMRSKS
ncbi:MAG: DoxX family protein [Dongiaceae bacterium]